MSTQKRGGLYGWLASYPKSGNTWMRLMLHKLQGDDSDLDINDRNGISILSRAELEENMGVESGDLTLSEIDSVRPELHRQLARSSKKPLLLRKVHDCFWRTESGEAVFPGDVSIGAIYIVRDPRDVAVSFAHHCSIDFAKSVKNMGDPDHVIAQKFTTQLSQPLGHWSQHVLSWIDQKEMPVLLVRYEDMLENPLQELRRVAEFLKISQASDEQALLRAVQETEFSKLQKQEAEHGFKEKPVKMERFFRRGGSGEGREVLAPELIAKIEEDHAEVIERLGYQS